MNKHPIFFNSSMAVPKKKTSKTKKAKRRYEWIKTAYKIAQKSISLSFRNLQLPTSFP
jgi:hypothetical protein